MNGPFSSAGGGTGYASVTVSAGGPSTPLAGIPSAVCAAEAAGQELGVALSNLIERLEQAGVLRPAPPRANAGKSSAPNFNSSLANAIDQQRARLLSTIGAIHELQDRIDL